MRSRVLFVLAGIFIAVWVTTATAQIDADFVEETSTYLSRLEKLGFAGVVLVAQDGKPALVHGYGLADRENGTRWTPTTVSTVGSITKQFSAAAILALQEQGRLRVEDGLATYFADVPDDKSAITLHHLLTHSSGIVDPPDIGDFDTNTRDEYVRRILDQPLATPPGEHYEYANANFSLLGAIIEIVTEKPYEEALQELIFVPAGMKETGYTIPAWDESRMAQGYQGDERWGTVLERPMAADGPYWALRANGGIYSTSLDMLLWAQALLENRVLSAKSRELMWTPYVDESNGGGESFYGYGWVVMDVSPEVRIITHNGGNGILFADFAIVPERNIVAFIQTNVVATFGKANGLLQEIGARLFFDKPYPEVPEVVEDPTLADRLPGTFTFENGETLDITADGNAMRVFPHGWTAYALVHSSPDQNVGALVEMSGEIDRIVGAYLDGDFGPLAEAYDGKAPPERLAQIYGERRREREAEVGPLKGYEVIGTGTGDRHHFTMVRFDYAQASDYRCYLWERDESRKLLGVTMRRIEPWCRFYPVAGGLLRSWEPSTGASVTAKPDWVPDAVLFKVERDDGVVVARRP